MRLQKLILISSSVLIFGCNSMNESFMTEKPVSYVDPFIGTGGHGHTFLGVTTPFGAVQIGPNLSLIHI